MLKNEAMETRIGAENENFIVSILASGFVTLAKPSGGAGLAPFGEHYIFLRLL